MRTTLHLRELQLACRVLLPALGSDLPIYGGVRLSRATSGGIVLDAFDGSSHVAFRTEPLRVEGEDSLVVPGRVLARFVEHLTNETVEIRGGVERAWIESGETRLTLHCFRPDEWPRLESPRGGVADLADEDIAQLRRVLFAVGDDDLRPLLKAVHIREGRAIATDTTRLASASLSTSYSAGCNIPGEFLQMVLRFIRGPARLRFGERRIAIETPNIEWTSSLIEGDYRLYALTRGWRGRIDAT